MEKQNELILFVIVPRDQTAPVGAFYKGKAIPVNLSKRLIEQNCVELFSTYDRNDCEEFGYIQGPNFSYEILKYSLMDRIRDFFSDWSNSLRKHV